MKVPTEEEIRSAIITALRAGMEIDLYDIASETTGLSIPQIYNGGDWAWRAVLPVIQNMVKASEVLVGPFNKLIPGGQFPLRDTETGK
jgi:hypothetical protein